MEASTNYLANLLGQDLNARMALREIPVFRTASEELLDLIYRYGRIFALGEGQELTREGEFDQWVYFIIDGRLDVFVGDERVDTLASSLVGERCILGEPRRATLRAGRGGISALGVDMALLDVLNDPTHPEQEHIAVYLELLGRIVGEIIQRLAEMEFNRLDVAHKYATYLAADRDTEIVDQMRRRALSGGREAAFIVYRHLARHEPVLLARVRGADLYDVDTRRLYNLCLELGRPEVLHRIAGKIRAEMEPAADAWEAAGKGNGGSGDVAEFTEFSHLLNGVVHSLIDYHDQSSFDLRRLNASHLEPYLALNEDMEIDLRGMTAFLQKRYGYSGTNLAEVLLLVLQEASRYTAKVNASLKAMLHRLGGISFVKDLRRVGPGNEINPELFYKANTPEDLIPFFSKNIIDVHLILPSLEKLGIEDPRSDGGEAPDSEPVEPPADESHTLVESLFD